MPMVDTDILIDLFRNQPSATAWLASIGQQPIIIPGFVAMEVLQGCRDAAEMQATSQRLAPFRTVWPSAAACDAALKTFSVGHLTHNLGLLDALIGHTALELQTELCTFNTKHYAAVAGLRTIQPYTRP